METVVVIELPLAPAQRDFVASDAGQPGAFLGPAFKIHTAVVAQGRLDNARFTAAVNGLLIRHPAMRSRLAGNEAGGQPTFQIVEDSVPSVLNLQELTTSTATPDAMRLLLDQALGAPISAFEASPFRVHLYRMSEQDSLVVIVAHHLFCDFEGLEILMADLWHLYRANSPLDANDSLRQDAWASYCLHSEELRNEPKRIDAATHYWSAYCSGLERATLRCDMAPDSSLEAPGMSFLRHRLSKNFTERYSAKCAEQHSFLNAPYATALGYVLCADNEHKRVLFSMTASARTTPETRATVGLLLRIFPVVVGTGEELTSTSLRTQAHVMRALRHDCLASSDINAFVAVSTGDGILNGSERLVAMQLFTERAENDIVDSLRVKAFNEASQEREWAGRWIEFVLTLGQPAHIACRYDAARFSKGRVVSLCDAIATELERFSGAESPRMSDDV